MSDTHTADIGTGATLPTLSLSYVEYHDGYKRLEYVDMCKKIAGAVSINNNGVCTACMSCRSIIII